MPSLPHSLLWPGAANFFSPFRWKATAGRGVWLSTARIFGDSWALRV
jgi:hypothetical protein